MSFIHLSTIQPTDGQQEVTDRTPSFIKNDFKNGILLKEGETIELVALRLAFDRIEIIEGVNDTMYFMLGDAPNFCQVEVKLTPGNYDEEGIAENLQTGLNSAINIPSFAPQLALDPNNTANPLANKGCEVVYVPATASANAKYTITWNQLANNQVNDTTLGSIAKVGSAAFKAAYGPPPTDPTELALYKLEVMNSGAKYSMRLPRSGLDVPDYVGVFNGGSIDGTNDSLPLIAPNTLYSYTDAFWNSSDYRLDTEEEVLEHNVGNDFEADFLSNQFTAQRNTVTSDREGIFDYIPKSESQEVENPQFMEGVLDTEGKITLGASPQQGYSRTELMKSFGTSSVAAGPSTTIISELNRNSRTGVHNASQKIDVPTQYQGHDVTEIELHLNNASGSVMDVELLLYDNITDATSTNIATRFAGLTPFSTTAAHQVPATGSTGPVDFLITADTSIHNVFYIVLQGVGGASTSGLSIQGSYNVDLGGTNGNMLAGLKHQVIGNTPAILGATVDKEWTLTYNSVGDSRAGTVTPLSGASADNFWDFRFDFTPALAPQNSTGQTVTRIYGVFSPTTQFEGRTEPGAIFWGVGTSTATNPGGTAGPPPDAQLEENWTFFEDKKGDKDLDISRFCYQNEVDSINNPSMEVKGFYASRLFVSSTELEDYYRVPWSFDNSASPPAIKTPSFLRTDGVDVNLALDTVLGYNPMRVGVNRRIREVNSAYDNTEVGDPASEFAVDAAETGALGISPSTTDLCDYFIQCRNTDPAGNIKVDGATKAYVPYIQVCVLERLENKPLYPDYSNVRTRVVYEDFIDTKVTSFDPTQDLVLQVQVKDMNEIIFSAASSAAQPVKWDENNDGPESPAGSAMTEIYKTVVNINPLPPPAGTEGDNGTTQIKQSDYPLMASITVGRGGHYPCKTQDATVTKDLSSYCWADGMLSRRPINPDNDKIETKFRLGTSQRKTIELWPKHSFATKPVISANTYQLRQMYKFGRLKLSDIDPSPRPPELTVYDNPVPKYYINSGDNVVRDEYFESNNIANVDRVLGMTTLINNPKAQVINGTGVSSEIKIRTHPFTDVFNVELLSEPVKSHNGARGDLGKSIYTITADELEIDTVDRIVSFTPKTRLPVDLNLVQDKTVYSLTCAIKDVNNRIIKGLRPPSDITLYKSLPEGVKIQRAVDKLSNIMTGKDNDRNANKIDNIGESNPLLGVIPR